MKKIVLSTIFAVFSVCAFAQTPIKFLGIPVDGSKADMIEQLKAKGYEYDSSHDWLFGEFNGRQVVMIVATNNNKVCRIGIMDMNTTDVAQIKIMFNNLYYQFLNNGKYELRDGKPLSDSEDISYEMTVHKKQYDASFVPKDKSVLGMVWYKIFHNFGSYRIGIFYDNTMNQANGEDL